MGPDIRQFVPSSVCLSCDGCCRFKEDKSPWRPKITQGEEASGRAGLAAEIFRDVAVDQDRALPTIACGGEHHCVFFHDGAHTCGIYTHRPFECALYPFIVSHESGSLKLYVHLSCPHIQDYYGTESYQEYVAYLKGRVGQEDVQVFLSTNRTMFQDYSPYGDELQWICDLAV